MTRQKGMIVPGTAVTLAIAMFMAAACQVACHAEASAQATRDSAGIHIIDNARPADDSRLPWRVGPEPAVSIGEVVGAEAYLLHQANDATILPDGRIVIANTGSNELRVFDAAGVHLATWGREGEGPGEFTGLSGVEPWPGDSVVAWNNSTWMISVFDAEGVLGRSFAFDSEAGALEPRAVLQDGSILGRTGEVTGDGYRRSRETYELRRSEGASPVEFGTHPGQESHMGFVDGIALLGFLPFGRSLWEAQWGELVILTTDDNYEIRAYDPSTGGPRPHRTPRIREPRAHPRGGRRSARGSSGAGRIDRTAPGNGPPGVWEHAHRGAIPGLPQTADRSPGPPLGARGHAPRHGPARAAVDGLRPRGAGAGVHRNA